VADDVPAFPDASAMRMSAKHGDAGFRPSLCKLPNRAPSVFPARSGLRRLIGRVSLMPSCLRPGRNMGENDHVACRLRNHVELSEKVPRAQASELPKPGLQLPPPEIDNESLITEWHHGSYSSSRPRISPAATPAEENVWFQKKRLTPTSGLKGDDRVDFCESRADAGCIAAIVVMVASDKGHPPAEAAGNFSKSAGQQRGNSQISSQ